MVLFRDYRWFGLEHNSLGGYISNGTGIYPVKKKKKSSGRDVKLSILDELLFKL